MMKTFIKNKGSTQTLIHNNNKNNYSEIDWDAEYDGRQANIKLDLLKNGKKEHVMIQMDNNDLAELLNIPTMNEPLEKRLLNDLKTPKSHEEIYLMLDGMTPFSYEEKNMIPIRDSLPKSKKDYYTHLSSPKTMDELLIPLTIKDGNKMTPKAYIVAPKKRHYKKRTHKTYKVYKVPASSKRRKSRRLSKTSRKSRLSF